MRKWTHRYIHHIWILNSSIYVKRQKFWKITIPVNSDIHNTKFGGVQVNNEDIFMQLKLSYCQHKIDWYNYKVYYESLMVITNHRYTNDKEKRIKTYHYKNKPIWTERQQERRGKKELKLQIIRKQWKKWW